MYYLKQLLLMLPVAGLAQSRPTIPMPSGNSDLNYPQPNGHQTPHTPQVGFVHIMLQCPGGGQAKEIASQFVPDTSIEAVEPLMAQWNNLIADARKSMKCKGGKEAQVVMKTGDKAPVKADDRT